MDYSKTIIYKIEHIENESLVYVGHTTNWEQRKYRHKLVCYNEKGKAYNLKVYQMIRENGGWNAFKMIEVEKYPCKDRREAEKRENDIIKELKANMNTYKIFLSEEEKKEYKEKIKDYNEKYYENNKDKLKKQRQKYYEINKERLTEQHKEYYEANKVERNEKIKEYYENNKEKSKNIVK